MVGWSGGRVVGWWVGGLVGWWVGGLVGWWVGGLAAGGGVGGWGNGVGKCAMTSFAWFLCRPPCPSNISRSAVKVQILEQSAGSHLFYIMLMCHVGDF